MYTYYHIYMCVIYVYMAPHTHKYAYVWLLTYMYTYMHIYNISYILSYMYASIHIWIYIYKICISNMCIYGHTYKHVFSCMSVYIDTLECLPIYIPKCIHLYNIY